MARRISCPVPGHYRMRLVKRGPYVPAAIRLPCPMVPAGPGSGADPVDWCRPLDRPRHPVGEIDGRPVPAHDVWLYAEPVDAAEYQYLREIREWAAACAPDAPEANPRRAIDLRTEPPPF
jgi:hypothetical protein